MKPIAFGEIIRVTGSAADRAEAAQAAQQASQKGLKIVGFPAGPREDVYVTGKEAEKAIARQAEIAKASATAVDTSAQLKKQFQESLNHPSQTGHVAQTLEASANKHPLERVFKAFGLAVPEQAVSANKLGEYLQKLITKAV